MSKMLNLFDSEDQKRFYQELHEDIVVQAVAAACWDKLDDDEIEDSIIIEVQAAAAACWQNDRTN